MAMKKPAYNAFFRAMDRWSEAPTKLLAGQLARSAIAKGLIERQPCACGNPKADAHHLDYTKPFDIEWRCDACHVQLHKCGTHLSDDTKARISAARMGQKASDETKARMSASRTNNPLTIAAASKGGKTSKGRSTQAMSDARKNWWAARKSAQG